MQKFLRWMGWALALALLWGGLVLPVGATTQLNWAAAPASSAGFARAIEPGILQFPQDFGPHPDYRSEWWYYTGNLDTPEGRSFGYQLTFFRQGLAPDRPIQSSLKSASNSSPSAPQTQGQSQWRGNQIYSAHFTVSDIAGDRFYPVERFSRGQVGLAGAQASPYGVWLQDWSAMELPDGRVRLQAKTGAVAIDLTLNPTTPVLQGDRGLSQKGPEPGNASYYYSQVQQPTQGTIGVGDRRYEVAGLSWMDHEFSTSSLDAGTVGWDWFSIQFDDRSSLMLYGLRQEDGSVAPMSAGLWIAADGTTERLGATEFQVSVLDQWTSPLRLPRSAGQRQVRYPSRWRIEVPKLDLSLEGASLLADQELRFGTVRYWEGVSGFRGSRAGQPIAGRGYVELTGYGSRLDQILGDRGPT
jgi:predicted secreted hydrolase